MRRSWSELFRCCSPVFIVGVALVVLTAAAPLRASSPGARFTDLSSSPGLTGHVVSATSNVVSRITTIPEPASCFLFGTGVFGALALRRRIQRRS